MDINKQINEQFTIIDDVVRRFHGEPIYSSNKRKEFEFLIDYFTGEENALYNEDNWKIHYCNTGESHDLTRCICGQDITDEYYVTYIPKQLTFRVGCECIKKFDLHLIYSQMVRNKCKICFLKKNITCHSSLDKYGDWLCKNCRHFRDIIIKKYFKKHKLKHRIYLSEKREEQKKTKEYDAKIRKYELIKLQQKVLFNNKIQDALEPKNTFFNSKIYTYVGKWLYYGSGKYYKKTYEKILDEMEDMDELENFLDICKGKVQAYPNMIKVICYFYENVEGLKKITF